LIELETGRWNCDIGRGGQQLIMAAECLLSASCQPFVSVWFGCSIK